MVVSADARLRPTILISTATGSEQDVARTLDSANRHASRPDCLRFVIDLNRVSGVVGALDAWRPDQRFRFLPRPGPAAGNRSAVWLGEDHVLVVGASSRFRSGWDDTLVEMSASVDVQRPLLIGDSRNDAAAHSTTPEASAGFAGDFMFSAGRLCRDVPGVLDDHPLIWTACRAYVEGYDLRRCVERVVWSNLSPAVFGAATDRGPSRAAQRTAAAFARASAGTLHIASTV